MAAAQAGPSSIPYVPKYDANIHPTQRFINAIEEAKADAAKEATGLTLKSFEKVLPPYFFRYLDAMSRDEILQKTTFPAYLKLFNTMCGVRGKVKFSDGFDFNKRFTDSSYKKYMDADAFIKTAMESRFTPWSSTMTQYLARYGVTVT